MFTDQTSSSLGIGRPYHPLQNARVTVKNTIAHKAIATPINAIKPIGPKFGDGPCLPINEIVSEYLPPFNRAKNTGHSTIRSITKASGDANKMPTANGGLLGSALFESHRE